uniref:Myosin XVIIIA n=1 Tax=Acrobeloides nanus TaxID=290746 RepID=A0A914C202_9BILA
MTNEHAEDMLKLEETKQKHFFETRPSPQFLPDERENSPTSMNNSASFGVPKDFNIPGLSLPALAAVQVDVREITLQKSVAGDFGFHIRRAQYPLGGSQELRSIVFAEPNEIRPGPPRPNDLATGLLPGDQLLEVEGVAVQALSREELLKLIQNAGKTLRVKVRAVPELVELCGRSQRGVRDEGDSLQLKTIDASVFEAIPEDERYWLVHSHGYTIARLFEFLPEGKARISVAGTEMIVDSSDIDRANPSSMDRMPELAALKYLNETSAIHLLRQRFGCNLQYTNGSARSLLYMASTEEDVSNMNDILVQMFRGCRRNQMPPHIYATAQQVYRHLQVTGRNQSVVLTGVTGSGKSRQLRSFVHYLCGVAGWTKALTFEKLSTAFGILEAFGNCATRLNKNSTRFIKFVELGFDMSAALASAKIQTFLLETIRLIKKPEKESVFHVFYYMWEGADDGLRARLKLDSITQPFIHVFKRDEDKEAARLAWHRLIESLKSIGFTQKQIDGICDVLGAIFHLAFSEATQGIASKSNFIRATNAQYAASLLGTPLEKLSQAIFRGIGTPTTSNTMNRFSMSNRSQSGQEALNNFIQCLYHELFSAIGSHINQKLAQHSATTWITLLDVPGGNFNSQWTDWGPSRPSTLNDLILNYLNERLAELFYNCSFKEPAEVYAREQVLVDVEKPISAPHAICRLLDQKAQLVNCVDLDKLSEENRGLLRLLEEESMFPGASDSAFFERIFVHFENSRLIHRHPRNPLQFVVAHCMNTSPTTYSVEGWVKMAQPSHASYTIPQLLQSSNKDTLLELFTLSALSQSESSLKLRRATQSVQNDAVGKRTIGGFLTNISVQLDHVFNAVTHATHVHFVHCVQPHPPTTLSSANMMTNSRDILDVPFVRHQLRSFLFIDAVRANNRGYPERLPFRDFRRRFQCLLQEQSNVKAADSLIDALDDRSAVQKILEKMDIYEHRYRIGISQVLLRSDVLVELEEKRDLSLSGLVVDLQRACRRHLAHRWLAKRRIQELAIKCVQKNGLCYLKTREWPWWKLYTRVIPLLSMSRADEEQREWRDKLRNLESANNDLRLAKTKLEGEVVELEQLLRQRDQTSQNLSLTLENEAEARIQLENEIRLLQLKISATVRAEAESEERRDSSTNLADWNNHEKTVELKTQLDKLRDNEAALKLKAQKATEQLQDVQAELENLRSRNDQLEKWQKNHDSEMHVIREQLEEAKREKERSERDRQDWTITNTKRNNEIQMLREENAELRSSLTKAKKEIDEITEANTNASEVEVNTLRKTKRELENKIADLEDELDELTTKNQCLEKNATRVEMASERLKLESHREIDAKENELSEIRAQMSRRLRAFEDEISELQDNNSSLLKQNRLLEARCQQVEIRNQTHLEANGSRYKREYKKALALLKDTQNVLAMERENAPSQSLIRQLREQMEEAEAAKLSALKGRHSLEGELSELRTQLESALAGKNAAEDKLMVLLKEKNSAMTLVEEHDEQLQALLKKYKVVVQQASVDSITLVDQIEQIAELEKQKQRLTEQLNEAAGALEFHKIHSVEKHRYQLLELKIRDLEAKLDLEIAHKQRLESIVIKLKDEIDSLEGQLDEAKTSKERELEGLRKTKKQVLLLQEQINDQKKREAELFHKYKQAKTENDKLADEHQESMSNLKVAMKRIESLQNVLNQDLSRDGSDSENEMNDQPIGDIEPAKSLSNGVHSVC